MLVRQALSDAPTTTTEVAELLVSELVTNAIRHAETDLVLVISLEPTIRISVEDSSVDLIPEQPAAAEKDDGRGLVIVRALAADWGCESTGTGKRTWFGL